LGTLRFDFGNGSLKERDLGSTFGSNNLLSFLPWSLIK
jgi:hypothetical protein